MVKKRLGNGRRRRPAAVRIVPLLVVALLVAMFASTVVAAPEDSGEAMDTSIRAAQQDCNILGGQASAHYEFNAEGGVDMATTTCVGGDLDGRVCIDTSAGQNCSKPFVKPTESIVPDQRPDTAAPVENPEQAGSDVDDSAAPPGGVAEDPTGGDETTASAQTVDDQVAACMALGGTATVNAQRPGSIVEVHCTGGMLDGMICYGTICDSFAAAPGGPGEDARIPTTGEAAEDPTGTTTNETTFLRVETMAEMEDALLAENPDGGETVVIYSQSGSPVDQAAAQEALCRVSGGTVRHSTYTRTVAQGQETLVDCKGGLFDDFWCNNTQHYTTCVFRAVTPEDPQVTPAAGVDAQVAPTPTPVVVVTEVSAPPTPTVAPPPPTLAPTAVAAEPTVAPPSDPPPPKNDNSVPPGGLEDPIAPEPTPTPVVLT